ncbi:MAG: hypothetical protein ACJ73E_00410 [Mycobacteriales bacterium]
MLLLIAIALFLGLGRERPAGTERLVVLAAATLVAGYLAVTKHLL